MSWGHYDTIANDAVFLLLQVVWNLLALDLWQQLGRYKRRKKEREQWR